MNSRQRRLGFARRLCTALLLGLIIWQWGAALHIQAKARLAQTLISRAWDQKLQAPTEAAAPWPWADTEPVGRLQWLENGVMQTDQHVLAGTSGSSLAFGPGLMQTGGSGPARVIAGHRDTHFAFLQHVQTGDALRWQDSSGLWQYYTVNEQTIVDSDATPFWVDPQENVLWLITCYPFDALRPGGPLRYVVRAERQHRVAGPPLR